MSYVQVSKLEFTATGRDKPILSNINFDILQGEFVIILGVNGSGKSTLLKILSGNLKATSGKVLIEETPINKISATKKACELIMLTQKTEDRLFSDLTLEENIILWESRFSKNKRLSVHQIIEFIYRPKRFSSLNQLISAFSGGEKQAILLALILAHPPSILFLDEHTSSLDPLAAIEIMNLTAQAINTHQITSFMITHKLDDALKFGNRLLILHDGKVAIDFKKSENLSMKELKEMMEYAENERSL